MVESIARELETLPTREARLEFSRLVDTAWRATEREFALRLDFNARLATRLRQLKVPIWGALETTAWDGPD
jgi:hypothetical protein